MATSKGSDAKYFQTSKNREIHELRAELNSLDKTKVKEAVKKVIAAMTVGKDVSSLFTDVVKSMQTDNIELKKLVYLYIINYARSQPDKAILVVNTFQKDATEDRSPLVRALAIRTMGCIRVDRIIEYLCEPLSKGLKDKDPYVRKTAAVCVAKLYDINPELVEEQGFLESLRNLISDPNPMVVANAVAALAEIAEASPRDVFSINAQMLSKLLAALNECTEWGQVFILDCLAKYQPSAREAEEIIERVSPRLKHVNSAVAMSAVKVIMKYLPLIQNERLERSLILEKLPPPLITLLSEQKPEIQYVALRNINLIVQKRPEILSQGIKHFFCKYNDPIYVKMEKLEIMIKLANVKNIDKVLMEFKEYATEIDVEFVRKSVLAIGRCAIKIDQAAEKCIKVLLELIQTKVNYVVQEAVIVIKDIFRKYPNRYESIIATLCENLDTLDEPEAKASMIWIVGEYADRIDNAPELLEVFLETFEDENAQVQLQLLTAVVKLFLKRAEEEKTRKMVTSVLNIATNHSDNPDLRDRGYLYWRLLSTDPEAAQTVVLAPKPVITDDTFQLDHKVLDNLISNISTLASVYHKPPEFFVKDGKTVVLRAKGEEEESEEEEESDDEKVQSDDFEEEGIVREEHKTSAPPQQPAGFVDILGLGLMDGGSSSQQQQAQQQAQQPGSMDFLGSVFGVPSSAPAASSSPAPVAASASLPRTPRVILPFASTNGNLQLSVFYSRQQGKPTMHMHLMNNSSQVLTHFLMKFNTNYLGVAPAGPITPGPIQPKASATYALPLSLSSDPSGGAAAAVQVAMKTELGVFMFADSIPAWIFFEESGQLDKGSFLSQWGALPEQNEVRADVPNRVVQSVEDIRQRLGLANVFFVAKRTVADKGDVLYFSFSFRSTVMLLELVVNGGQCYACVKSAQPALAQLAIGAGVVALLQQS